MPFDPSYPPNHAALESAPMRSQLNGLKDLIDAVPAGPQGPPGANGTNGADGAAGSNGADGSNGRGVALHTVEGDKFTASHAGWVDGDEVAVVHPRVATLVFGDAVLGGPYGDATVHGVAFVDENGAQAPVTALAMAAADLATAMAGAIAGNCHCTAVAVGAVVTITSQSAGTLAAAWTLVRPLAADDMGIPALLAVTQEGGAEVFVIVDGTQLGTGAGYADLRGVAGADGADGAAGAAGEVSNGDLAAAIAGTASNANAVATLDTAFTNDPPTLADVELLRGKVNELIVALRR